MPEYVLPRECAPDWFAKLERRAPFIAGYIKALFFTYSSPMESTDPEWESDGSIPADYAVGALAPATWARIFRDCKRFLSKLNEGRDGHGRTILDLAIDYAPGGYSEGRAGRDFWFSRCGHGVGFFDRGLGEVGDSLQSLAESFGAVDSYVGDDGLIYLA